MSSSTEKLYFGPFEVTEQVFLTTPHSFALVNLKPLLPGHVLVCPRRPRARLTDMDAAELTDLFSAVQRVQRMLAWRYFASSSDSEVAAAPTDQQSGKDSKSPPPPPRSPEAGSFNVAVQDGPGAGQTVPHVHVHVIPRPREHPAHGKKSSDGGGEETGAARMDAVYDGMASEKGNVGGALWDAALAQREALEHGEMPRPRPGGEFPAIEDAMRHARSREEMEAEAEMFRGVLREMDASAAASGTK